jgi:hypothetical protein
MQKKSHKKKFDQLQIHPKCLRNINSNKPPKTTPKTPRKQNLKEPHPPSPKKPIFLKRSIFLPLQELANNGRPR